MESGLPNHIRRYLQQIGVDPNDLSDEVKVMLAGLTSGEVALLKVVGDTLREAHDDNDLIAKVH